MPPGGNQHLGLLIRNGGHPGQCKSRGPAAAVVPPVDSTTLVDFALGPLQPNPVTKKFPGILREFPVVNAGEKNISKYFIWSVGKQQLTKGKNERQRQADRCSLILNCQEYSS